MKTKTVKKLKEETKVKSILEKAEELKAEIQKKDREDEAACDKVVKDALKQFGCFIAQETILSNYGPPRMTARIAKSPRK